MMINFLGRKEYQVAELDAIELEEMQPNDCGVLTDSIEIVCYQKKSNYLKVMIGRAKDRYYTGYDYWLFEGGASSGAACGNEYYKPKSYGSVKEAFVGQLNDLAGHRRVWEVCKIKELLEKVWPVVKEEPTPEPEPTPKPEPQPEQPKSCGVEGCTECPLWIVRAKTKKGVKYVVRNCTTDICEVMKHSPTQEDVDFFCTFHKEPTDGEVSKSGYSEWLKEVNKKFNMAEAPKLW